MQGKVLDYTLSQSAGIISGDDGKRYTFSNSDWNSSNIHPTQGLYVDFTTHEESAKAIYAVSNAGNPSMMQIQETSSTAIVSLVFGILGFLSSWWLFAIPSIVAIITGHVARSTIARSEGKVGGDGFAIAGLILGYAIVVLYLLIIFAVVGTLAAASM